MAAIDGDLLKKIEGSQHRKVKVAIDDEGNGKLELDELTEIFTVYAELKKARLFTLKILK